MSIIKSPTMILGVAPPHPIDQSIRFNDADNPKLGKTFSGAGTEETWTFSCWIKLGVSTSNGRRMIFSAGSAGSNYGGVELGSTGDDSLEFYNYVSSSYAWRLRTTQQFRDPSAWYHLVFVSDTTNAVSTERARIYVNGVRVTSFTTESYPSLNYANNFWMGTTEHEIGTSIFTTQNFDGYMAEIVNLDGTATDCNSFAEFNSSGIWVPKDVSGLTFGTNGFHIKGENASDLGNDSSGNGNNFTTSGLASHDKMSDSPTTNWCVMNPLLNNGCTYTNGNLEVAPPNNQSTHRLILGTQGILPSDTNKYYWEITYLNPDNTSNSVNMLGIGELDSGVNPATSALNQSGGYALGYNTSTSNLYTSSVWTANGTPTWSGGFTAGAVYGVAYDGSTKRLYFYENNTALNSGNHFATYTGNSPLGPGASLYYSPSSSKLTFNMGNNGFTYTPPTGYVALNTTNLGG